MKTYETEQQIVKLNKDIKGKILDIGGGGEGVIGQLYQDRVIAIDSRQDELDEAPVGPIKMLMSAENLDFDDNTFDAVTSFFTMMYIDKEKHDKVLKEIYRVLNPEGKIYLWDSIIEENTEDYVVFVLNLKIILPDKDITTGYGITYREQNIDYFIDKLETAGFNIFHKEVNEKTFYIVAEK